jgi:hypothetical protein
MRVFAAPIRRRNPVAAARSRGSGVLLDRAVWNPCLDAHGMPALARVERPAQLLAVTIADFGHPRAMPIARARSRPAFVRSLIFSRSMARRAKRADGYSMVTN